MRKFALLLLLPLLASCGAKPTFDMSKGEGHPYYLRSEAKGDSFDEVLIDFSFEEIDPLLEAGGSALVLFHTSTCSHCQVLEPNFAKAVSEAKAAVYSADDDAIVEIYQQLRDRYSDGIDEVFPDGLVTPTLVSLNGPSEIQRIDIVGLYRDPGRLALALSNAGNYTNVYLVNDYDGFAGLEPGALSYLYEGEAMLDSFYEAIFPLAKTSAKTTYLVDVSSWSEQEKGSVSYSKQAPIRLQNSAYPLDSPAIGDYYE